VESRPERGKTLACLKPATMDAANAAIEESVLSCSVNRGNGEITMAEKINTAKNTVIMRPAVRQRAPLRWKMTYRHAMTSPRCIVANGNVPRTCWFRHPVDVIRRFHKLGPSVRPFPWVLRAIGIYQPLTFLNAANLLALIDLPSPPA
jgi:hypothetical protein